MASLRDTDRPYDWAEEYDTSLGWGGAILLFIIAAGILLVGLVLYSTATV